MAPGLARKVKKILDIKVDASSEVGQGLKTLATFYEENSASSRRRLRSTIERRAIELSEDFLRSADLVIRGLDGVQQSLDDLSTSCSRCAAGIARALLSDRAEGISNGRHDRTGTAGSLRPCPRAAPRSPRSSARPSAFPGSSGPLRSGCRRYPRSWRPTSSAPRS